jgi:hypothetical protein
LARTLALPVLPLQKPLLRTPFGQLGDVAGPRGDVPVEILALHARWRTAVARVGPHVLFLAVQQIVDLLDVCLICSSGFLRSRAASTSCCHIAGPQQHTDEHVVKTCSPGAYDPQRGLGLL